MVKIAVVTDSNTGVYRVLPRCQGEVRKHYQEFWDADLKGWGSAVFIEDDDGMRWVNMETGEEFSVEERPHVLLAYADHPPWKDH